MNDEREIGVIMLPNVRCAFLYLDKPHAPPNSTDAKYSADFLLDLGSNEHLAAWEQLFQDINTLAIQKWGEMTNAIMTQINNDPKLRGYGDGNTRTKKSDMSILSGYQGHWYITAKNPERPQVVGSDGKVVDPTVTIANVKKPYSGCYVHALVRVWLQDNQFGRGIRFDLVAVQFAADGEAFGPSHMEAAKVQGYFKPIAGAPAPVTQPGMPQPGMPQPGVQQGQLAAGSQTQQQNVPGVTPTVPGAAPQPGVQPPWV